MKSKKPRGGIFDKKVGDKIIYLSCEFPNMDSIVEECEVTRMEKLDDSFIIGINGTDYTIPYENANYVSIGYHFHYSKNAMLINTDDDQNLFRNTIFANVYHYAKYMEFMCDSEFQKWKGYLNDFREIKKKRMCKVFNFQLNKYVIADDKKGGVQ